MSRWQRREWRERGATLTVWVDAWPKQRHGRLERRELWALADPELNGCAGTVGKGWPHLQLTTLAGRIRNFWDRQPPKACELILSLACVSEFLRNFGKIGLILDGGETSERLVKAITTFNVPSMADWATTNVTALVIMAILLWTLRPMIATAVGKCQQWKKSVAIALTRVW